MPTWSDLANGPRWRGLVSFIRNWVGPFDASHGIAPAELADAPRFGAVNLPTALQEWHLLAANWEQGGLNVWIRPHALTSLNGMVRVLTDTQEINHWGIRVEDLAIENPPVVSLKGNSHEIDFPMFTSFVAAMVVNDVVFDYGAGAPVELKTGSVRADLTCLVSAQCGAYYTDVALESANFVAFTYPGNGPAFGKARAPAGSPLLERLRLQKA